MPKSKDVNVEVARRGLVSVMNDTKWRELQKAVRTQLPFAPPYQLKVVMNPHPHPEHFEADVNYLGDWGDECLSPFREIEWIRVRPRFLHRKLWERTVPPEVRSVESDFLAILARLQIPYRRDGETVWIYGYAPETGALSEPDSPAHRSQPVGSDTSQTSSAAGSGG